MSIAEVSSLALIANKICATGREVLLLGTSLFFACWVSLPPLSPRASPVPVGVPRPWLVLHHGHAPTRRSGTPSVPAVDPAEALTRKCKHSSSEEAWEAAVLVLDGTPTAAPSLEGTRAVLAAAQLLGRSTRSPPLRLVLLSRGAQPSPCARAAVASNAGCAHGGAWGLARVLRLEQPRLRIFSVDAADGGGSGGSGSSSTALAALAAAREEPEVAWANRGGYGARLRRGAAVATRTGAGAQLTMAASAAAAGGGGA